MNFTPNFTLKFRYGGYPKRVYCDWLRTSAWAVVITWDYSTQKRVHVSELWTGSTDEVVVTPEEWQDHL